MNGVGGALFSHGTSVARGVEVFYRKEYTSCIKNVETDNQGRYIIFDLHVEYQCYHHCGNICPQQRQPSFLQQNQRNSEK